MSGSRTGGPRSASFTGAAKTLLGETIPEHAKAVAGTLGQPTFDIARGMFKSKGYKTALKNVDHFLSGAGGTVDYSYDEISSHPLLMESIGTLRNYFETETFTGKTKKEGIAAALLGLKDGGKLVFSDNWANDVGLGKFGARIMEGDSEDTYWGLGRTGTNSVGRFVAERYGNDLFITGNVNYRLGDRDEKKVR